MCKWSVLIAALLSLAEKASADLSAQLNRDRAHAEALGIRNEVPGPLDCTERFNIEACLGSLHRNTDCAWCGEQCISTPVDKLKGCHNLKGDAHDLCLTCTFRYTCSQWAGAQEDGGCAADETVVVWGDDDPKQYASYRQFSGYQCRDLTCDSKEECCYKPKSSDSNLKTCATWPDGFCEKYNRLPKASKADIVCGGAGCRQSDCCDNTCAKHDWGYCRKGTLYPKDVAKTIRCMTPSKYKGADPECSDEQCCDFGDEEEQKFSDVPELAPSGDRLKLVSAVAMISGLSLAGFVVVAMRRRVARSAASAAPGPALIEGCE